VSGLDPAHVPGTRREPALRASAICSGYGTEPVIRDVSLHVRPGEVVALLGANGAGKTTTLRALVGELPCSAGAVEFHGAVTTRPLHWRARHGLGYVSEERSIFTKLTVAENLSVAGGDTALAYHLFPALAPLAKRSAGVLSGGEQQMLALARALSRQPSVLLADELSLGLAPLVVDRLLAAQRAAADERNVAVLMVEQHARKALAVADRGYVLRRGRIELEGAASDLLERIDQIEDTYLAGHHA
jgi:branched-chain amino acid transport system ATP-binding protein